MDEISEQIRELKSLMELDVIPEDVKKDIKETINIVESLKEYDGKNTINDGKINVNFINKSNNKNPVYVRNGDSGFDLRANIIKPITLKPLERTLIDTGLFFELPKGYDMEIRSRSGLALKNGVMVLNSPGTIDLEYRGNIGVILINFGSEDFTVNPGDRIAQALIRHSLTDNEIVLKEVKEISDTDRGNNGFGSTGV